MELLSLVEDISRCLTVTLEFPLHMATQTGSKTNLSSGRMGESSGNVGTACYLSIKANGLMVSLL